MPKNQLNRTVPASPQRDGMSDMHVAVFMRLLPDSSMVKMAFANCHITRVPTIDGRVVCEVGQEIHNHRVVDSETCSILWMRWKEGSKYFSSIDLASGFLQLEIHEDDRHLTGFRDADG